MVFDTGDPTQHLKREWFELRQHDTVWSQDIPGRTGTSHRCYDAEHVLEWQLLKQFIEEDKEDGEKSRCELVHRYFGKEMEDPEVKHKVKRAKNNGRLGPNDHFDYEEVDFSLDPWNLELGEGEKDRRYIDWISKYM